MATSKQDKTMGRIVLGVAAAFVLFALLVFGFGKNDYGHTGFQIIFSQGTWYVITMLLFFALAVAAAYGAFRVYNREQDLTLGVYALAVVAIVFLSIAFGKGCTDKDNDGVTGPRGRPVVETKTFPH